MFHHVELNTTTSPKINRETPTAVSGCRTVLALHASNGYVPAFSHNVNPTVKHLAPPLLHCWRQLGPPEIAHLQLRARCLARNSMQSDAMAKAVWFRWHARLGAVSTACPTSAAGKPPGGHQPPPGEGGGCGGGGRGGRAGRSTAQRLATTTGGLQSESGGGGSGGLLVVTCRARGRHCRLLQGGRGMDGQEAAG